MSSKVKTPNNKDQRPDTPDLPAPCCTYAKVAAAKRQRHKPKARPHRLMFLKVRRQLISNKTVNRGGYNSALDAEMSDVTNNSPYEDPTASEATLSAKEMKPMLPPLNPKKKEKTNVSKGPARRFKRSNLPWRFNVSTGLESAKLRRKHQYRLKSKLLI